MRFQKIILLSIASVLFTSSSLLHAQRSPYISFDVQPGAGCSIVIQWEVVGGMDTFKYEVEKSGDKQHWVTIANKTLHSSHRYFNIDAAPADSFNYYRVRQVVSGDQSIYSEIKWVQVNTVTDVFIWPNPARDVLYVKTPLLSGTIDVTDAGGTLIRKIMITDFITEIATMNLADGIYFLNIRSSNRVLTERFIKK
jgi:hypothetical protein